MACNIRVVATRRVFQSHQDPHWFTGSTTYVQMSNAGIHVEPIESTAEISTVPPWLARCSQYPAGYLACNVWVSGCCAIPNLLHGRWHSQVRSGGDWHVLGNAGEREAGLHQI